MENEEQQAVQNEQPQEPQAPAEDITRPVSTPAATPDPTDPAEQVSEVSPSQPDDLKGGDDTEGKKPSRLERRVDDLVTKLKEVGQQTADPSSFFSEDPIFTQEEIDSGTFNPLAVQQRLMQREQAVQARAAQQALQAVQYQATINEHVADIDQAQKELGNDPKLDALVAKQYAALNYQTDPRTGARVFVPQVKMSDIVKDFKDLIASETTNATADVQARLSEQAGQQAVPSSVSNPTSTNLEAQATYEKALQSGREEDWAEVLKKRI